MEAERADATTRVQIHPKTALGHGELDTPDGDLARWFSSARLLHAVANRYPEVIRDLQTCPLTASEIDQDSEAFQRWVIAWAKRYWSQCPLHVLGIVAEALSKWKHADSPTETVPISFSLVRKLPLEAPALEPFHPVYETRREWNARVAEWTDQLLGIYRERGYRKARRTNAEPEQFDWLARILIKGVSVSQIAREVGGLADDASHDDLHPYRVRVHNGVHRLAKTMGFKLRLTNSE